MIVALTNAEKQKRWREKRNRLAEIFVGKPKEISERILLALGPDQTRKIVRALEKRLRNLRPDCPICDGTGFWNAELYTGCGMRIEGLTRMLPCKCGTDAEIAAWCEREKRLRNLCEAVPE